MRVAIFHSSGSTPFHELRALLTTLEIEPIEFTGSFPIASLEDCHGFIFLDKKDEWFNFIKGQNQLGKPLLGLGSGAEGLIHSGCIPGIMGDMPVIDFQPHETLEEIFFQLNENYQLNAFTHYLTVKTSLIGPLLKPTVQFVIPPALHEEMQVQGQIIFSYCNPFGERNGGIAGISNKRGNALALLPLIPIAVLEPLLISMRETIQTGTLSELYPLYYYPHPP